MAGMRHFGTGATRDQDTSKFDYEGFNSPLVEKAFASYMNTHRIQPDGSVRASDNWQLGIPLDAYIKSLIRHVEDLRLHHRGVGDEAVDSDLISVLCAIRFNVNGYLLEVLKAKRAQRAAFDGERCIDCGMPFEDVFYGAGDGRGQMFRCQSCQMKREERWPPPAWGLGSHTSPLPLESSLGE